jgi:hypothetical protein
MVVAEGLAAQGGGAAAAARGMDVTAEVALDGDLGEFGGVGHRSAPLGEISLKPSIQVC